MSRCADTGMCRYEVLPIPSPVLRADLLAPG
jgi:hypothetical protein